jgi:4-amino-4-deoxy-L-arabinose transferase-like glycosyltransferase
LEPRGENVVWERFEAAVQERHRWLLVGLIGLAFALQVIGLGSESLWRDEIDAIRFASQPLSNLLGFFVIPGQNGPLYYLVLRPWLHLAGQSEMALRFLSLACGVLAVPLVYRLGRRLFPSLPSLALLAALLAATSPYLVWYGQEGKMYTVAVVLVLFSMDRYLAALERGGWHRWLLYLTGTSAMLYVHLIAALIVPTQAILFLLTDSGTRRARWKPWLASMALLTFPYLPLLRWQLPLILNPSSSSGYAFVSLPSMLYSLLANYSLGVLHGQVGWSLVLFVGLLLAAGLVWQGQTARLRALAQLVCWLLVPVLGFFLVTLVRPMYTARYLIFVLPAYLLLLAAGAVAVWRHSRLLASFWLVALLATSGRGVWAQARTQVKADFRGATQYVATRMAPDDLLLFQIPYGRHSFDYYYEAYQRPSADLPEPAPLPNGRNVLLFLPLVARGEGAPYLWEDGFYTNGGMSLDAVDLGMSRIVSGKRVVWFIATEVSLWDERELVQNWLEEHATLTDEAHFVRVTVKRYELP